MKPTEASLAAKCVNLGHEVSDLGLACPEAVFTHLGVLGDARWLRFLADGPLDKWGPITEYVVKTNSRLAL